MMRKVRAALGRARRLLRLRFYRWRAARAGVAFVPPNCIFMPHFSAQSLIVDAGCGSAAELSVYVIQHFGARALGIDPTKKHAPALQQLAEKTQGRFQHLDFGIGAVDGVVTFYESMHQSGSIFQDHANVKIRPRRSYEVEMVSLRSLPARIGAQRVDLLKLDLEGGEYEVLRDVAAADLAPYEQIFVEFHHHCVARYSRKSTRAIVKKMRDMGLRAMTFDGRNYLFHRQPSGGEHPAALAGEPLHGGPP
jgi:FkbM family methyltransferase